MKVYRLENKNTLDLPKECLTFMFSKRTKLPIEDFSLIFNHLIEERRIVKEYKLKNPGAVIKNGYSTEEELEKFLYLKTIFNIDIVELEVEPIHVSSDGKVLFHDKRIPN